MWRKAKKVLTMLLCICIIGTNLVIPATVSAAGVDGQIFTMSSNPRYAVGDTFGIQVVDHDLDTMGMVTVKVVNTEPGSSPDGITVNLKADSSNPGNFYGYVKISDVDNGSANPPTISGALGNLIRATYTDALTSTGGQADINTDITVSEKVDAPAASLNPDTQEVSLTATEGALIYYTRSTNQGEMLMPNSGSTLYNDSAKPTVSGFTVIRAIATKANYADSKMTTFANNAITVKVTDPSGTYPEPYARVEIYGADRWNNQNISADENGYAYFDKATFNDSFTIIAYPADNSAYAVSNAQTMNMGSYNGDAIEAKLNTTRNTGTVKTRMIRLHQMVGLIWKSTGTPIVQIAARITCLVSPSIQTVHIICLHLKMGNTR